MTTTPPPATTAPPSSVPTPSVRVASWRMVTQSVDGACPTTDATLRVHVDDLVVMATGDGSTPAAAYAAAERSALEAVSTASVDADAVRTSLRTALGVDHACVSVEAVHADGLMGRVAALITPFPVTDFAYHRSSDGDHAHAALCLEGTPWQIERVAQKIRRVVGVLAVHSDATGHDS